MRLRAEVEAKADVETEAEVVTAVGVEQEGGKEEDGAESGDTEVALTAADEALLAAAAAEAEAEAEAGDGGVAAPPQSRVSTKPSAANEYHSRHTALTSLHCPLCSCSQPTSMHSRHSASACVCAGGEQAAAESVRRCASHASESRRRHQLFPSANKSIDSIHTKTYQSSATTKMMID